MFGGPFPGEAIIPRLYSVHVLLLPAILVGLFTVHIVLVALQKHTQFPGPGRTNENVVGYPVMPVYAAKAGGFFFIVFGVVALMSALVTINPIWAYGPYDPSPVTAGSQPDWYMGFADGALRLLPGFLEFEAFGFTFSFNVMIGAILLIPVMYGLISLYPFLEEWVTGDKREHHLLDRPRNNPTRTGIGMAGIAAYAVLMFGAGNDLMAIKLGLSINDITRTLQLLFFVAPPVTFWVTKRICLSLQRRDRDLVLHGRETGRIIRTAEGRFFEKHEPVDAYTRWNLVQHEQHQPLQLEAGVDENGVASPTARKDRLRAKVSHFYFKDRVEPVTPAETRGGPPRRAPRRGDRAPAARRCHARRGRLRREPGQRGRPASLTPATTPGMPRGPRTTRHTCVWPPRTGRWACAGPDRRRASRERPRGRAVR